MEKSSNQERSIGLVLLVVIAALGAYLFLRGGEATTPASETVTPEAPLVPLIDIALERAENAAEFTISKPRLKTEGERSAAYADAFVPLDIDHETLVVTTKNALIGLYEQIDPLAQRWLEVRVFLDGEPPDDRFVAARGVLNHDMEGWGDDPGGAPWRVNVRLVEPETRRAQGISDATLKRILTARQTIEQTRTALLVEGDPDAAGDKLLRETAKRHGLSLASLRRLTGLHRKLYTADRAFTWDLK
jgi:hypothetical protein